MTVDVESVAHASDDARELRRGAVTAYLGYALKLAFPVLLALATRAYGAERWGRFVTAQAFVLFAMRVCLWGLDKAVLWYVPQHSLGDARRVVLRAARVAGSGAVALCLLVVAAALTPRLLGAERAVLAVCALSLPALVVSEVWIAATMGLRRMELQVLVRDTLAPAVQVLLALALARLAWSDLGLALAFTLAQWFGLYVSWRGFRHWFGAAGAPPDTRLPEAVRAYSAPLGIAELGNSLLLRLDTLVLAALASPETVGVWSVVAQFGNALRQIRRSYDPMITALAARIALDHDARRLGSLLSYAMQLVTLTQLPVFAAFTVLAELVLPLYGEAFSGGASALVVLSALFLVGGGAGLAGLVIAGYGRPRLVLGNVLLGLVSELVLLLILVPRYGLLGAACAVGASLCLVNAAQMLELRAITGSFHVPARTRYTLALALVCCAVLYGSLTALAELAPFAHRALSLSLFLASYLGLVWLGQRRGWLSLLGAAR